MEAKINLITIWTDDVNAMKEFYSGVMGFEIESDLGNYVEFKNEGVRFAICNRLVMNDYSNEYTKKCTGQAFELAFQCKSPEDVKRTYEFITSNGGKPVKEPQEMPWDQITAFFSDPDGNIHEIFAELK
ncbi:MAG: VOC family protein [Methanolobus sp.]